jgi:hypothetical protein
MRLPRDWSAERSPGYGEFHYLTHDTCGWRSSRPYDVILNETDVRRIVYGHRCEDES